MATWVLRVRERFEAAHHLRSYRGRPEPVHGHSWLVEVVLESRELDGEGMAVDFVGVKAALKDLVAPFHHADVNTVPPFDELSPTTEHLARWLCSELDERTAAARGGRARIAEVTVWEGPDCAATYRP
jgi:6-pyruvoyltetrahydropterin/6-carboxytetrahydropterin synthase